MPILFLIVAAMLWGGAFTAGNVAVPALPPLSVAILRSSSTAAVMAPRALGEGGWAAARRGPAGPAEIDPQGGPGR